MKKIIVSICTLALAAALLGTSTYAWFSMNKTVTAGSMEIKATTDANLVIAKGASVELAGITGTAVTDLGVSATAVTPCDLTDATGTVTVKYPETYTTDPTVGSAGSGATWKEIGTITNTTVSDEKVKGYVAVGYVTIARKQTKTDGVYKITPSCTVTCDKASNLNKAMRAGLIINGKLYESNDANSTGDTAITFTFSDVTGLADNTAYSVALLLWFEGEDSDCYANNAVDLSKNTANWTFTSADNA